MRVHVVSDVHGRADALARAAEPSPGFACDTVVLVTGATGTTAIVVALAVTAYNFVRVHRSLRMTPAMAALVAMVLSQGCQPRRIRPTGSRCCRMNK